MIENGCKYKDCKYSILNYISDDFWMKPFKKWFPNMFSYNRTDFRHSACFTMYLNLSPVQHEIGTEEFKKYLMDNGICNLLRVDISVISFYVNIKYIQYVVIDENIEIFDSRTSFISEYAKYSDKLRKYIQEHCLQMKSFWSEGENGVALTQEAWVNGKSAGNPKIRTYEKEGMKIKVYMGEKGSIHGYPVNTKGA